MPDLPPTEWVRRAAVRNFLGVSDEVLSKMVRNQELKTITLKGHSRKFFIRANVLQVARELAKDT